MNKAIMLSGRSSVVAISTISRYGLFGGTLSGRTSVVAASSTSRHGLLGGIRTLKSPAYRRMMAKKSRGIVRFSPTLLDAKTMPNGMSEMDNESLVSLAAMNNLDATVEVLKRHIMSIDDCSYETASKRFDEIQKSNHKGMWLAVSPYLAGIGIATGSAIASLPLCFYLPAVETFNADYVTADVPEQKDLETWLEVGSWAWNWMEPPLGTFSFVLLCLQFSRAQMVNLGLKPFTTYVKERRADRLCREYPGYDKRILSDFSKSDHLMGFGTA